MKLNRVGIAIFPVTKRRGDHDAFPLLLPVTGPDLFPNISGVVMAYAFDRARLKYGYKLLRGADFDKKGAVDEDLRNQRFNVLKLLLCQR